jgi:DNA-binding HxlR family transcriptional regulator
MPMKSYGQFCPVAKAAEVFCERWTPLILRDLGAGSTRFSELQRGVPLMSPTLLSRRLKQLESEGIIERRTDNSSRSPSYHLTDAGREFVPLVEALGIWGQRWTRRDLEDGEVDLGLLIWSIERSVDPAAFGSGRTVVHVHFFDQPAAKRNWWFINENGQCDICVDDPGYDVNLYITATLPDMIRVVRGDIALARALSDDTLLLEGDSQAIGRFREWFKLSPLAAVEPVKAAH